MLCSSNNTNARRKRRVSTIILILASLSDKTTRVHSLWVLTVKIFDVGFESDGSATRVMAFIYEKGLKVGYCFCV